MALAVSLDRKPFLRSFKNSSSTEDLRQIDEIT